MSIITKQELSSKLSSIINQYSNSYDIEQLYIKLYNLNTNIRIHIDERLYNDYLLKLAKVASLLTKYSIIDHNIIYNCIIIVNNIINELNIYDV